MSAETLDFRMRPSDGRGWFSGVEVQCMACGYVEAFDQLPVEKERLFAHAIEAHGIKATKAAPAGEAICPPMHFVRVS